MIFWLSEECWGRGLVRLGELLEELLIERQAEQPEQPEPPLDPELEAQTLLRAGGNGPHFSGHRLAVRQTEWIQWLQQISRQVLSFWPRVGVSAGTAA